MVGLTPHALLFTLAAIGISETSYLIKKRRLSERPVCPIGTGCEEVLQSKYNTLFGVHNDILGFIFYVAMAFITSLLVIENGPIEILLKGAYILLFGATFMSLYFTYLQWKVIHAWCFWCLMSAVTIVLMDIFLLLSFLS